MDPFLQEEESTGAKFDPLVLLRKFWRRRWLFVVPFVLCLAMATIAIKVMTPIFESAAQIRVVHESTSRLIQDGTSSYVRARDVDNETLSNIWTIITAPKFLEMVAREADLVATPMVPDSAAVAEDSEAGLSDPVIRAANRLRRQVRARPDGTHIFEIAVRDPDPQRAFTLARLVLDRFLEDERATRTAPRTSTRDFLERQRQTRQADLDAAERKLNDFQRASLNASLVGNPVTASNLSTIDGNVQRLQEQLQDSDKRELDLQEAQARTVISPLPNVTSYANDAEVAAILSQVTDAVRSQLLGTSDPRDQDDDLGRLRIRLNDTIEQKVMTTLPQLGVMDRSRLVEYLRHSVYRRGQQRALDGLVKNIRDYRSFTIRQPEQSARMGELQAEVDRQRDLLAQIDREVAQQQMNLEASLSEIGYRIEVRRDPALPTYPVEPDKMRLYVMGFALSFGIGIGLVLLSIMLDRSFTTVQDIERALGIAVIGTLPVIQDDHFQRQQRRRILRWVVLTLLILGVAALFLFYLYPKLT